MKTHLDTASSFIVGLIFGIGLIFAGMTEPSKVIGFLDISGLWDPSLAFVMAGAILVGLVAFRFARYSTPHKKRYRQASDRGQPTLWRRLGHGGLLSWPCSSHPGHGRTSGHHFCTLYDRWHGIIRRRGASDECTRCTRRRSCTQRHPGNPALRFTW